MYWNGMLCKIKLSEKSQRQNGAYFTSLSVQTGRSQSSFISSSTPVTGQAQIISGGKEKLVIRHHWEENKLSALYLLFLF